AVKLLQIMIEIVIGAVLDRQVRIVCWEEQHGTVDRSAGMEALVVAEAALLQQLGPFVAGPPAAVPHPAPAEIVLERQAKPRELVPALRHQLPQDGREALREPLIRIQKEDPAGARGVNRQVAGGIEV